MSRKSKRMGGKYISITVHPRAKRKVKHAARRAARTAKPMSIGFIIGGLVVGGYILYKMLPASSTAAATAARMPLPADVAPEPS